MEAHIDEFVRGIGMFTGFVILVYWRRFWSWLKGGISACATGVSNVILTFIVAKIVLQSLRSLEKTLRLAKTPEERAYVLLRFYSVCLKQAASFACQPGTPSKVKQRIRDVNDLVQPMMFEYTEAVRRTAAA